MPMCDWRSKWARIVLVVVLPCVPATQRGFFREVICPKACARFWMCAPCDCRYWYSRVSVGTAGVQTTGRLSGAKGRRLTLSS